MGRGPVLSYMCLGLLIPPLGITGRPEGHGVRKCPSHAPLSNAWQELVWIAGNSESFSTVGDLVIHST